MLSHNKLYDVEKFDYSFERSGVKLPTEATFHIYFLN